MRRPYVCHHQNERTKLSLSLSLSNIPLPIPPQTHFIAEQAQCDLVVASLIGTRQSRLVLVAVAAAVLVAVVVVAICATRNETTRIAN